MCILEMVVSGGPDDLCRDADRKRLHSNPSLSAAIAAIILVSCINDQSSGFSFDKNNCTEVDTANFFYVINQKWPARKPESVAVAVLLLDSIADDTFRCSIVKMKLSDMHFTIGQKLRNQWVNNGTKAIRDQLFGKLKITHADYTSGLIIDIYRLALNSEKVDLAKRYIGDKNDSVSTISKNEFYIIQKELAQHFPASFR